MTQRSFWGKRVLGPAAKMVLVRAREPGAVGSRAQQSRFPHLFDVRYPMNHGKLDRR